MSDFWSQISFSLQQLVRSATAYVRSFEFQQELPSSHLPAILLGKQYVNVRDSEFLLDWLSRPWMTYRSQYPPIHPSLYTNDLGWGCMLRSGQMLLCNAFILWELGRDWRLSNSTEQEFQTYTRILSRFLDSNTSPFSIHKIAFVGQQFDKKIGQWFGPSTISQVLKVLLNEFQETNLLLYLANDAVLYKSQIYPMLNDSGVLILIPLKLGVDTFNPIYAPLLKKCLESLHCVGIAGGRPNSSYYFLGYQEDQLLYLDPHVQRTCVPIQEVYTLDDLSTYHTKQIRHLNIQSMDPSLVIGFLCKSAADFDLFLTESLECNLSSGKTPLFTIEQEPMDYEAQELDILSDVPS